MEKLTDYSRRLAMTCLALGLPWIVAAFVYPSIATVGQVLMVVAGIAALVNVVALEILEGQVDHD